MHLHAANCVHGFRGLAGTRSTRGIDGPVQRPRPDNGSKAFPCRRSRISSDDREPASNPRKLLRPRCDRGAELLVISPGRIFRGPPLSPAISARHPKWKESPRGRDPPPPSFISPNAILYGVFLNESHVRSRRGQVSDVHTRARAIGIIFRYAVTLKPTSEAPAISRLLFPPPSVLRPTLRDRVGGNLPPSPAPGGSRSGDSIRQSGNLNC